MQFRVLGTLGILGSLWLILINRLRLDWETNPQYSFAWTVPFLAAYLFLERWRDRPQPAQEGGKAPLVLATILFALWYPLTRLVHEAAPEWSAVSWALALETLGFTLIAIQYAGGWRMARHFAWPILFFLAAVAWPVRLENAVTQGLMRGLANIAVELLGWAGFAASARGNLIELSSGVVGIDEACSGVRSLQSMLAAGLFLGEFYRYSAKRRIAVVVIGLALAVCFNIVRTLILVGVSVHYGITALKSWHDPAGFSILAASFVVLFSLVRARGSVRMERPRVPGRLRPLPTILVAILAVWLITSEIGVEAWYRMHETTAVQIPKWSVQWPQQDPSFSEVPIPATVSKTLAYNEGRQGRWRTAEGLFYQLFAFKWYPGRSSTLSARLHRPETCLPAGGQRLVHELPPTVLLVGDSSVPFRTYQFDYRGRSLFVFFCLAEVGSRDQASAGLPQDYSRESRLARVRIGQRNLGQQSVEVIVAGAETSEAAIASFRTEAPKILRSADNVAGSLGAAPLGPPGS